MQIGELFFLLGFDVEDSKLRGFDQGLLGLINRFDLLKIATIGAAYALDKIGQQSLDKGVNLHNLASQTGENIREVQEWAAAAHAANPALSIDQVTQSIQGLDNALVAIRLGQGGNNLPLRLFGINPLEMHNAIDVLKALRQNINKFDKPETSYLLSQLGLPPGIVEALRLPQNKWNKFIKDATISHDAIEKLYAARSAVADLENKLDTFALNLTAGIAPQIEAAMQSISDAFVIFRPSFDNIGAGFNKVYQDIKLLAENFPLFAKALVAGVGLIVASLAPLTTLLAGTLYLIDQIEGYQKGDKNNLGKVIDNYKETDLYKFLYKLGQGEEDIASGRLKKNYVPDAHRYDYLTKNNTTTIINNDVDFHGLPQSGSEKVINHLEELRNKYHTIDQNNINQTYQDQKVLGTGY